MFSSSHLIRKQGVSVLAAMNRVRRSAKQELKSRRDIAENVGEPIFFHPKRELGKNIFKGKSPTYVDPIIRTFLDMQRDALPTQNSEDKAKTKVTEFESLLTLIIQRRDTIFGGNKIDSHTTEQNSQTKLAMENVSRNAGSEKDSNHYEYLREMLRLYNPSLSAKVIEKIKKRMQIDQRVEVASKVLDALRQQQFDLMRLEEGKETANTLGENEVEKESKRKQKIGEIVKQLHKMIAKVNGDFLRKLLEEDDTNVSKYLEESSGIVGKLYKAGKHHSNTSAFISEKSDIQVNEIVSLKSANSPVLKNRIVSLTEAMKQNFNFLSSEKSEADFKRNVSNSFHVGDEDGLTEIHLHLVLFRSGLPLEVFVQIIQTFGMRKVSRGDIFFSTTLDDHYTSVQRCSITFRSRRNNAEDFYRETCETVRSILLFAEQLEKMNERKKDHNSFSPSFALQLLGWYSYPCGLNMHHVTNSNKTDIANHKEKKDNSVRTNEVDTVQRDISFSQYSVMLRGIKGRNNRNMANLKRTMARALQNFPNFYAPRHFGPTSFLLFRTFHVQAALSSAGTGDQRGNQVAEAILMAVCLCTWRSLEGLSDSAPVEFPEWVYFFIEKIVVEGEDRPAYLRELWYNQGAAELASGGYPSPRGASYVSVAPPPHVVRHFETSIGQLLFNVLLSCRIEEIHASLGDTKGKGAIEEEENDIILDNIGNLEFAQAPAGDFVFTDANEIGDDLDEKLEEGKHKRKKRFPIKRENVFLDEAFYAKSEDLLNIAAPVDESKTVATRAHAELNKIVPVLSEEERETQAENQEFHSLVRAMLPIPVTRQALEDCDALAALAAVFFPNTSITPAPVPPSRFYSSNNETDCGFYFRPMFASATGYPFAARPYTRFFPEVAAVRGDGQKKGSLFNAYHLATDYELASRPHSQDFAEQSRGRQKALWPLSSEGRSLVQRLPVGLSTTAAFAADSDGGDLVDGFMDKDASRAPTAGSYSLALHCALSNQNYLSNILREVFDIVIDESDRP